MEKYLKAIISNKRLVRYFVMAVIIVILELVSFQVLYTLSNNYVLSTIISFSIAVILNWIGGRLLVFGASTHNPAKEFFMVLIASLFGVIIQLSVVFVSVDIFHLYPLVGKAFSIIFSFFWNYLFRSRIVYKSGTNSNNF